MTTFSKFMTVLSGCAILLAYSSGYAAIHNLGTFGQTYPIAEKDAVQELKDKASVVDWNKTFNPETTHKAIKNYKPEILDLPLARENKTRLVDLSYSLEFDIPDGKGGILYPKGYMFNPLEYVHYAKTLIVINADDPKQVAWFLTSDSAKAQDVMLLITNGSYYELSQKLNRPVYYATANIIQRLQLRAVPCVVRQNGKYMEINEIALSYNQ
jgi:conjugal transfer pilus assembly protein TraW